MSMAFVLDIQRMIPSPLQVCNPSQCAFRITHEYWSYMKALCNNIYITRYVNVVFNVAFFNFLLYPHFLKKVRVYCCNPFLSVRPSVRKKSLSLELRLHFKDLRNDTLNLGVSWSQTLSTFLEEYQWYSRRWLAVSCRCAIRLRNFHFAPRVKKGSKNGKSFI